MHHITAAWLLGGGGPETKLRASWGTGAKAPGPYQLFDPTFGSPALGVEESSGYDFAVDRVWPGGATLRMSYFNLDIENEIDFLWPDGFLNLRLTARARYRSMNAASFGGITNSFVVVDLQGSYQVTSKLEIYGRIVNLLDEHYQYEWRSSTYDRSLFAGVRLRR